MPARRGGRGSHGRQQNDAIHAKILPGVLQECRATTPPFAIGTNGQYGINGKIIRRPCQWKCRPSPRNPTLLAATIGKPGAGPPCAYLVRKSRFVLVFRPSVGNSTDGT